LLRGELASKDGRRQDEGFCDGIIALHIIGGVGFGIALRLRLSDTDSYEGLLLRAIIPGIKRRMSSKTGSL
jgi:hypothetical protein